MTAIPSTEDLQAMQIELSHVMGMWSRELSDFEVSLWKVIMSTTTLEKFGRALKVYIFSPQAKFGPPTHGAIAGLLGLTIDPDAAYAQLESAVQKFGPYQAPEIADPTLIQAIQNMGGWAAVNASMPAPTQAYEVKVFKERFTGCLTTAVNQVRIEAAKVSPLQPIGAAGLSPASEVLQGATAVLPRPERFAAVARGRV